MDNNSDNVGNVVFYEQNISTNNLVSQNFTVRSIMPISLDMVLSARRCTRECWLRYHEFNSQNGTSESTKAKNGAMSGSTSSSNTNSTISSIGSASSTSNLSANTNIPNEDTELYLQDDHSRITFIKVYTPQYPAKLTATICLCSLAINGAMAILVCNETNSYEEERLALAFASYALFLDGIRCRNGLIRSSYGGGCQLVTISDLDISNLIQHLNLTYRIINESSDMIPKFMSRRCDSCKLADQCLPYETAILNKFTDENTESQFNEKFMAPKANAEILYVSTQGSTLSLDKERVKITNKDGTCVEKPLGEISEIVVYGGIQLTSQLIQKCCFNSKPIVYLTITGNFVGMVVNSTIGVRNAINLSEQIVISKDPIASLHIAKSIVKSKIRNQRTIIRRNMSSDNPKLKADILNQMSIMTDNIKYTLAINSLMGLEGNAAKYYFESFGAIVNSFGGLFMNGRSRRPPKDPVNAMLSFGYSLLLNDILFAILKVGLSPWVGFMHTQRSNKPSLALDLMEEFRPCIVDSLVLALVSKNMLQMSDFEVTRDMTKSNIQPSSMSSSMDNNSSCSSTFADPSILSFLLNNEGRKKFIKYYDTKMNSLMTHPYFKYKCSWRDAIHLQIKILCMHLRKELNQYIPLEIR